MAYKYAYHPPIRAGVLLELQLQTTKLSSPGDNGNYMELHSCWNPSLSHTLPSSCSAPKSLGISKNFRGKIASLLPSFLSQMHFFHPGLFYPKHGYLFRKCVCGVLFSCLSCYSAASSTPLVPRQQSSLVPRKYCFSSWNLTPSLYQRFWIYHIFFTCPFFRFPCSAC